MNKESFCENVEHNGRFYDAIPIKVYNNVNRTHHASGVPCATRWDFYIKGVSLCIGIQSSNSVIDLTAIIFLADWKTHLSV